MIGVQLVDGFISCGAGLVELAARASPRRGALGPAVGSANSTTDAIAVATHCLLAFVVWLGNLAHTPRTANAIVITSREATAIVRTP